VGCGAGDTWEPERFTIGSVRHKKETTKSEPLEYWFRKTKPNHTKPSPNQTKPNQTK